MQNGGWICLSRKLLDWEWYQNNNVKAVFIHCLLKANYEEKISAIEAKIAKKQDELKALKAQLSEIKSKKAQDDYKELTEYMAANNLSASEVLASIKG